MVYRGTVDTHCHLFLIERDPQDVLEVARGAGVERVVCAGVDPESSLRSREIAARIEAVSATAGMHPHTASELDEQGMKVIEELLSDPLVLAVGECGLDFFRNLSPAEDQERVFRLHCAWSRASGKPMVVHVRDAWPRALEILADERPPSVVLHCFSGDADIARECVARGYFLSFAGNVTYPKNTHLREAVAVTPIAHLLVETDSPYLSPQGLRGMENSPANVSFVVRQLASVLSMSVGEVAGVVTANTERAFPGMR
jgi:TatD DNase family protein